MAHTTGREGVNRLREGENRFGVFSSTSQRDYSSNYSVIVLGLGESLGGADRPSRRSDLRIYMPVHAHECIPRTRIGATPVTSISIAEIFMAINRRTWPRPVNYVRRSTDYDAAALFVRDISPRNERRFVETQSSRRKKGNMLLFSFSFSNRSIIFCLSNHKFR